MARGEGKSPLSLCLCICACTGWGQVGAGEGGAQIGEKIYDFVLYFRALLIIFKLIYIFLIFIFILLFRGMAGGGWREPKNQNTAALSRGGISMSTATNSTRWSKTKMNLQLGSNLISSLQQEQASLRRRANASSWTAQVRKCWDLWKPRNLVAVAY